MTQQLGSSRHHSKSVAWCSAADPYNLLLVKQLMLAQLVKSPLKDCNRGHPHRRYRAEPFRRQCQFPF